jgi:uncharacterized membrane protein YfcA
MSVELFTSLLFMGSLFEGASVAHLSEGSTNLGIGIMPQVAAAAGAIAGAAIAGHLRAGTMAVIFGLVLIYSSYCSLRRRAGPA